MRNVWMIAAVVAGAALAGCGKSATPAATGPATTAGERIKQDVEAAGHDLHSAATEAATQIKPGLERAGQEGREAIHSAAQKVADWSATQPATQPGTMPATQPNQ